MRSYFGQVAPAAVRAPVMPVPMPMVYGPYAPTRFVARMATAPSQPYQLKMDPKQMEREIYKDLPTSVKGKATSAKTNPQKLITLKSGLEVPAYILQRDRERKSKGVESKPLAPPPPPPPPEKPAAFHKIGNFATKRPFITTAIAFGLGYYLGNWYYDFQQSQK